jgi:hypothetical protein
LLLRVFRYWTPRFGPSAIGWAHQLAANINRGTAKMILSPDCVVIVWINPRF